MEQERERIAASWPSHMGIKEYAVYFDDNHRTYRLPVNPEEVAVTSVMATEKYSVLGMGQIVVPAYMELREITFEAELPYNKYHYIETAGDFRNVDQYEAFFKRIREQLKPVQFVYSNGKSEDLDIPVLIEEFNAKELAGQEGDKYYSFKLVECPNYEAKRLQKTKKTAKGKQVKIVTETAQNPKKPKNYVVKAGDNLWNIAKKFYGDGSQYKKIYQANRKIIQNPALIYKGQKLTIPD